MVVVGGRKGGGMGSGMGWEGPNMKSLVIGGLEYQWGISVIL